MKRWKLTTLVKTFDMPWNPEVYNQFKDIRFQPFYDLSNLIEDRGNMHAVDLGCGTGEQTAILSEKFPTANFIGIDASSEMLGKSKMIETERLHFRQASTEEIIEEAQNWDLIFSNAALQWSDNHAQLFTQLIAKLNLGGQLAVQMPNQPENVLNKILFQLAQDEPFATQLHHWNRRSSVLRMDQYAQILFENGMQNIHVSQKIYPIVVENHQTLFDFISGSALIPYLERLDESQRQTFIKAFIERIAQAFPRLPAIYAFKRLFLYGHKKL